MNETSAAPFLARHLNAPADDMVDVEHAASALSKLASAAEYEDLRTFFALYRATADEPSLVNAVISVGGALLRVGGPQGRTLVERASEDPLTEQEVRTALAVELHPPPADSPPAPEKAPSTEKPAEKGGGAKPKTGPTSPPPKK